ncbi:MAG: flagellar basal body-associated FliL family protein [Pseudomonadota bacterium]
MAEATANDAEREPEAGEKGAPRKRGLLPMLIGVVAAAGAGGGAYIAVGQGLLPPPVATVTAIIQGPPAPPWAGWTAPNYVEIPPILVSLGAEAEAKRLRLRLMLEVAEGAADIVAEAEPRIVATLVRLLRAVDERDFEQPALMLRLQSQMLRRVHLVTPPDTVDAILIQEFLID